MRKIFAVRGVADSGKSTMLLSLITQIRNQYRGRFTILHEEDLVNVNGVQDVFLIVEIQGIRIGFFTEGDWFHKTRDALLIMEEFDCQIMIFSCRTRMSSFRAIEEFVDSRNINQVNIYRTYINATPPANDMQQNQILRELNLLLLGIN